MNKLDIFSLTKAWAEKQGLKIWAERETSSTNTIAKEDHREQTIPVLAAGAKTSAPSLYLTEKQTGGRGRGENRWETPPTAALLSSWSFALAKAPQPVLSPLVGLALFEAAHATWPDLAFNLKAPNDLFIGSLKVAGLLIEAVDWGHSRHCVVGLGFNVSSHPAQILTSTSLLEALGESSFSNERWESFLTALSTNLHSAVIEGQSPALSASVRERLKQALNRHPLLAEPILDVDELGQLRMASQTILWHQL